MVPVASDVVLVQVVRVPMNDETGRALTRHKRKGSTGFDWVTASVHSWRSRALALCVT